MHGQMIMMLRHVRHIYIVDYAKMFRYDIMSYIYENF